MAGENAASSVDEAKDTKSAADQRQRSTVSFPYNNLNDAIEVAQAIHGNVGTGECDDAQLSAWLNMSPKSSGYRVQVSAARLFGLVDGGAAGYRLSNLGRMIVDPQQEREARARAFLSVPLYQRAFEQYRNGVVPPTAALERDFVGFGVAEKTKERARQVFERSADQAGFFEHGRNRLVMPGFAIREPSGSAGSTGSVQVNEAGDIREKGSGGNGGGGGGGGQGVDPIIAGLLARLPKSGEVWPTSDRKLWLQLLEGSFQLIYRDNTDATNSQ